jgi:hypothetical protein
MALYDSISIINLHNKLNQEPLSELAPDIDDSLASRISANHIYNRLLWEEEDLARRRDVSDTLIAQNKRNIDGFNQKRNDAIEKIDEFIIATIDASPTKTATQHTETIGAIIDRLSILSLKIKAMGKEAIRSSAGAEHTQKCSQKLSVLIEQRNDLAAALDKLFTAITQGEVYDKIYRQYKMYNDPTLNPALYSSKLGN